MKSEENHIDFENSIGPWLGQTVKVIEYFLQESFNSAKLDLTKEQMVVLKKLHNQNGLNQNELAFLTLKDKSSLTRLLTKMENKNYITRKQSKEDKRVKNVYITPLGEQVFMKAKPHMKKVMEKMEENVSLEEKQQIINTLKKIQTNFCSKTEHI
jgi:DNA-binding MarR family transcriptional regulator